MSGSHACRAPNSPPTRAHNGAEACIQIFPQLLPACQARPFGLGAARPVSPRCVTQVWQGPNGLLVFTWRNSSADLLLRDTVTVHHLTLNGWEVEGMPQSPAQREASLAAAAGAAAAGAGVGFGDVKAVAAELVAAVGASSEEEEAASRHRAMGAAASSGASGEGLGSPQGAEGDVAGAKKGADEMLVQRFVVEVREMSPPALPCLLRRFCSTVP